MCIQIHNDRNITGITEECFEICYGFNYKYEGTLSHSFDRFYVVTKFELPRVEDLK